MKREGSSCLTEALVVPSVARSLSLTSSDQVQLRRQLCTLLDWGYRNFLLTSSSSSATPEVLRYTDSFMSC